LVSARAFHAGWQPTSAIFGKTEIGAPLGLHRKKPGPFCRRARIWEGGRAIKKRPRSASKTLSTFRAFSRVDLANTLSRRMIGRFNRPWALSSLTRVEVPRDIMLRDEDKASRRPQHSGDLGGSRVRRFGTGYGKGGASAISKDFPLNGAQIRPGKVVRARNWGGGRARFRDWGRRLSVEPIGIAKATGPCR